MHKFTIYSKKLFFIASLLVGGMHTDFSMSMNYGTKSHGQKLEEMTNAQILQAIQDVDPVTRDMRRKQEGDGVLVESLMAQSKRLKPAVQAYCAKHKIPKPSQENLRKFFSDNIEPFYMFILDVSPEIINCNWRVKISKERFTAVSYPLHGAINARRLDLVEALLRHGADARMPSVKSGVAIKQLMKNDPLLDDSVNMPIDLAVSLGDKKLVAIITTHLMKRCLNEAERAALENEMRPSVDFFNEEDIRFTLNSNPAAVARQVDKLCVTCAQCAQGMFGSESAIKYCGQCRVEPYCSRDCQKKAWKEHKRTCIKRVDR